MTNPRRRTNAERSDKSRKAIIAAATPIFARRGFAAASLNEIIRASGLTKGGFYFLFPSKLALAVAVVEAHQQSWGAQLARQIERHEHAMDRLFAVPRILVRMARRGEGPAMLNKLVDELAAKPNLRSAMIGSLKEAIDFNAGLFREARAAGGIRGDLDPILFAEVVIGAFYGIREMTGQLGDNGFQRRIEGLIKIVQRGISGKS